MKTICAWCEKVLKGDVEAEQVSYGICTPCLMREMDAIGLDGVQDILDRLEREMCPV